MMRFQPQIPAYLAGGALGHWVGQSTDFYAFALLGGLVFGIVLAGLFGHIEDMLSEGDEQHDPYRER